MFESFARAFFVWLSFLFSLNDLPLGFVLPLNHFGVPSWSLKGVNLELGSISLIAWHRIITNRSGWITLPNTVCKLLPDDECREQLPLRLSFAERDNDIARER